MTRVILHIGAPKTGTSFVQSVLGQNRALLAERGICFPGRRWADQVRAVEDLRDQSAGEPIESSRWTALAEEVHTSGCEVAIVSMEWLCLGDAKMAARAVAEYGQDDVHVMLTVRDLARTVPAQWQESTQNGFGWTYERFLKGLRAPVPSATRPGRHFWGNQDWGRMLRTWAPLVPSDRLWLVTVPPSGTPTDLLWNRFCSAAGIDPDGYTLQGWPNESLGAVSAELMRRLQVARRDEGPNPRHKGRLKHRLAKDVLARRKSAEPSLTLPPQMHSWALRATKAQTEQIREVNPRIVGDLADLEPRKTKLRKGLTADPAALDDSLLLDAAIDGLLGLTRPRSKGTS